MIHTEKRSLKCDVRDKICTSVSALKRHILTHTGERNHTCDICGKLFSKQSHLKQHMSIHTGKGDMADKQVWLLTEFV